MLPCLGGNRNDELVERVEELLDGLEEDEPQPFNEPLNEKHQAGEPRNIAFRNEDDVDITPEITSRDQIQLESYKSISIFSGVRGTYKAWRNLVARRMKMINAFKTHPKYEAALGIIRAKITGTVSDAAGHQQPRGVQKINQLGDKLQYSNDPKKDIEEERDIDDDLASISSHLSDETTTSAFLDE